MNVDAQHAQWRTELWLRLAAFEPAVIGRVASRTRVSRSDLEELWSDLLSTAVQAPGTPGAMGADAMALSDPELRGWLTRALLNDATDLHRGRTRRDDGTAWIEATPLEDLERTLQRHTANSPELEVVAAETARSHLQSVHDVAGRDAARFVVAEAAGVRSSVDRGLLGITRAKVEDARVRLELSAAELRVRMRSVIVWLLPDTLMRWLAPLFATGNVPRLGAVGIAVVALAGGGTAAVHQAASSKSHPRSAARTAASKVSARTLRPVHLQIPAAGAAATVRQTAQRQQAAQVAAATAARKARKRRAAAKAAAAARKASTQQASAASQLTQQHFGTQPASSESSSAPPRTASTASNSDVLAHEFEPGGSR